jgi:hypothetical protein
MLGLAYSPNTMSAMLRPVFLAAAFSLALSICPASAQDSDSDVVTRLDRLEGAIRDLTGNIEQLQYRNQQLEQQVQRLQAQIPGGAPAASAPPPPAQRPSAPYQQQAAPYPQPQSAPYQQPAPIMAPEPAGSAPVDQAPGGRRGDAFNPALSPGAPGAPRPLGTSTTATEPPPPARVSRVRHSISRRCRQTLQPCRRVCRRRLRSIRMRPVPCRRRYRPPRRRKISTISRTVIFSTKTTLMRPRGFGHS